MGIKTFSVKTHHHQVVGHANKKRTQIYEDYHREPSAYILSKLFKVPFKELRLETFLFCVVLKVCDKGTL